MKLRKLIIMVAVVCCLSLGRTAYCCEEEAPCEEPIQQQNQEQGQGQEANATNTTENTNNIELIDNSTQTSSSSSEVTSINEIDNTDEVEVVVTNDNRSGANSFSQGGKAESIARQGLDSDITIQDNRKEETIIPRNVPSTGFWGHGPRGLAESDALIIDPVELETTDGENRIILYQDVKFIPVSGSRGFLYSPDGCYALPVRYIGFVTKKIREGVFVGQYPPEEVVEQLANKAVKRFPIRHRYIIKVSKCERNPQVKQKKLSVPFIVGGSSSDAAAGGNPGVYVSTELEGYVARADVYIPIWDPIQICDLPLEEEESEEVDVISGIDERINERSATKLKSCDKANEDNAISRIDNGSDHVRLSKLSGGDDATFAAEIDKAYLNFNQSVKDFPSVEGYLFLAYTQMKKGWNEKALKSLRKAGYPDMDSVQLEDWVNFELTKHPATKGERLTPVKAEQPEPPQPAAEEEEKPAEKPAAPKQKKQKAEPSPLVVDADNPIEMARILLEEEEKKFCLEDIADINKTISELEKRYVEEEDQEIKDAFLFTIGVMHLSLNKMHKDPGDRTYALNEARKSFKKLSQSPIAFSKTRARAGKDVVWERYGAAGSAN